MSLIGPGGGVYNTGTLTLFNSTVSSNIARYGGGVTNEGTLTLVNSIVSGNIGNGSFYGGGGGISNSGMLTLTNSTISGNFASWLGGGIDNNRTELELGGNVTSGTVELNNSVVALNYGGVFLPYYEQNIEGGYAESGSFIGEIDSDPGFVRNPSAGADDTWGTTDDTAGDYHLIVSSVLIDGGDSNLVLVDTFDLDGDGDVTEPIPFDIDGNARMQGTSVDIGAYESDYTAAATLGVLSCSIANGQVTITDCATTASGELVIPATIEGLPVTTIGYKAFDSCYNLTSVTIPDSVTSIGDGAFAYCYSLTSVTIPGSVTSIEDQVFRHCRNLTSVTIGDSVTSIGAQAFQYCDNLTSIVVDPNNTTYASEDGVLFNKDKTTLIQCPGGKMGDYTVPDSVTTIGGWAFNSCSSLTSVTIGNSVTTIGRYAFNSCSSLTSVTIGNSVTTIGVHAFSGCSGLTSVTIPDSVTSIGAYAFQSCGLTSVTIGNSVTTIGDYAFSSCDSLTSVTIPDSVTTIGEGAFYGCSGLTSVTIPDSVTTIGEGAFYGCSGLTSVTIPDSVTTIGAGAFDSCYNLTSVTFEGDAPAMGSEVFYSVASTFTVRYYAGALGFTEPTWQGYPSEMIAPLVDEDLQDRANARDLGDLSGTGSSTTAGEIGGDNDIRDYYKFSVDRTTEVNVVVSGMDATTSTRLQLLDADQNLIDTAPLSAWNRWVSGTIAPGTYYIQIYSESLATRPYKLRVDTFSDADRYDRTHAEDLGAIGNAKTEVKGAIGKTSASRDYSDWYEFTVTGRRRIMATLSGLTRNANIQLCDAEGNVLKTSARIGRNNESVVFSVTPEDISTTGTYYLRVYSTSKTETRYTLSLKAVADTEKNIWQRAGDLDFATRVRARNTGYLSAGKKTFTGQLGEQDRNDWFKFTTRGRFTRKVTLTLTGLTANLDLEFYSARGRRIATSANDGVTNDVIIRNLRAGTYYVRVRVPGLTLLDETVGYTLQMLAPRV